LRRKWQNLPKLVAITGGFLIMMGIFLLGVAALSISGYLDIGLLLEGKYLLVFAVGMAIIGLLDTLAAIVIARWR
jgi:hypothetical protein